MRSKTLKKPVGPAKRASGSNEGTTDAESVVSEMITKIAALIVSEENMQIRSSILNEFLLFAIKEFDNIKDNSEENVDKTYDIYDISNNDKYIEGQGRLSESKQNPPLESPAPMTGDERLHHLDALLATVPKDASYEEQTRQLERLKQDFNQKVLRRITDAIKEGMRIRKNDTYPDKLESTRWLTGELQRFNLAIRSPKVGGLVTLSADPAGRGGGGRFKLKAKNESEAEISSNFNTTDVSDLLENIEIIEAPPRREGLRGRVVKARNEKSGPSVG